MLCIADRVELYPPEKLSRGLDLVTVSVRRPAADALDPRVGAAPPGPLTAKLQAAFNDFARSCGVPL